MGKGAGPTTAMGVHRSSPKAPTWEMREEILGPPLPEGNGSTGLDPTLPGVHRDVPVAPRERDTHRNSGIATEV